MNRFTRSENGIIADAGFYNRLQYANAASLLLLSDTHGAVDAVRWILSSFGGICDACLFAGDGAQDILTVVREAAAGKITIPPVIIMAQGNCDNQLYPPVFPDTGSQKPFGLPVYQQSIERFGSVTAINPGSPLRPRGKSHGGFALLSLRTGQVENPEDTANTGDDSATGLFSKVQFYQLIQKTDGAFSASAHAVYPIPIRQSAGD